jgi:DNA-binding MarR family transcriptional regulator
MEGDTGAPGEPGDEPDWHVLMEKLADIEDRLAQMPEVPPSQGISDQKLATIATSIYRARRRRLKYFDPSLLGEPAWDMLLDLFIGTALGRRINLTSLWGAAEVPHATARRHFALLEEKGLVKRNRDRIDRRVVYVEMTPLGYKQMRRYIVDGIGKFDLPVRD